MNEETTDITKLETKKKKTLPFIVVAAVALTALIVGISIYNTPANRVQRQLDLGNKYLEEENYEQAALAFEEVIAIDERCMEAYVGGLEAYLGAGDMDGAQDFYDRTLAMLSGLNEDFLAENMDYAVELYLAAEKVYGEDRDKAAQVLEDAYTVTGEDARIKDKLVENYIEIGKKETQDGSYEDALAVYDRLLELDNTNPDTISGLCECLNKYIDILMEAGRYDEIRALADKYKDVAVNVDFDGILAQIEKRKTWVDISPELFTFQIAGYDLWENHTEEVMDALRSLAVNEEIERRSGWTIENLFTEEGDKITHTYSDSLINNDIGIRQPVDWDTAGKDGYISYQGERKTNEKTYRNLIIGQWSAGAKWAGGEREETIDFDKYIHCPVGKTAEEWYSLIGREQIVSRGQEADAMFADSQAWRFQTEWGEGYYEEMTLHGQNVSLLAIDCSAEKGEKQIFSLCVEMDENGQVDALFVYTGNCYAWDESGVTSSKITQTLVETSVRIDVDTDVFHIFENDR